MNSRKLCAHTQRGHIHSCKRLAAFLKRSPETATCEDVRLFQLHLADSGMSYTEQELAVILRSCVEEPSHDLQLGRDVKVDAGTFRREADNRWRFFLYRD